MPTIEAVDMLIGRHKSHAFESNLVFEAFTSRDNFENK